MRKIFTKEVKIGIFTVIVLAGAYFGLNYLKSKRLFSNDNIIYAVFNQADGLEVGAPVIIKGFKIGTVEKINFDIRSEQLLVKLLVNGEYPLPINSEAKIASTSLLGGKVLEVKLGNDVVQTLGNGDTIRTSTERNIMDVAGEEYGKLKEMASDIVTKLSQALDGMNKVLSDDNARALSATLANLSSISGNINEAVSSPTKGLKTTMENISVLSASLREAAPDLQRGLHNIALLSDTLSVKGPVLISNAAASLDNLNQVIAKVNRGEGSAGKLINDEALYKNLNEAVANMSILLADLKANPKRYINVTVFGGGNRDKKDKK